MGTKQVIEYLKSQHGNTLPPSVEGGWYDSRTDSIFYYLKDEPHDADRIDNFLTVFLSLETGDVTGVQIKGVRSLLLKHDVVYAEYNRKRSVGIDTILIALLKEQGASKEQFRKLVTPFFKTDFALPELATSS